MEGLPDNLLFSPNRIHGEQVANEVERLFKHEMWLLTQLLPRVFLRLGRCTLEESVEAKREIGVLLRRVSAES